MSPQKDHYVTLTAALKFSGLAETGGQARKFVNAGFVKVNGEVCFQKGRKLFAGDIIEMNNRSVLLEINRS